MHQVSKIIRTLRKMVFEKNSEIVRIFVIFYYKVFYLYWRVPSTWEGQILFRQWPICSLLWHTPGPCKWWWLLNAPFGRSIFLVGRRFANGLQWCSKCWISSCWLNIEPCPKWTNQTTHFSPGPLGYHNWKYFKDLVI